MEGLYIREVCHLNNELGWSAIGRRIPLMIDDTHMDLDFFRLRIHIKVCRLDVTFVVLYILNGGRERRVHGHFVILRIDVWYYTLLMLFSFTFSTLGNKIPRCF